MDMINNESQSCRHAVAWRSLLAGAWLAFVASVFLRPNRGEFDPWLDVGVYNISFGVAALACACRARSGGHQARAWWTLSAGLALYAGAAVYSSLVIGDRDIYPSLADAMWLSFYVLVYVALVTMIRSRSERFLASTWLDGATVGAGSAAVVAAFVLGPVLEDTSGRFAVVATNLAYPVADLLLLVAVLTWVVLHRGRDAPMWWLAGGLIVLGIGDVVFLYQSARDTYAEGGVLDVSWPLGAALIGLAATARAPEAAKRQRAHRPPFAVPAVFTACAVGVLVYGQWHETPVVTVLLAVVTLALAAARTALTVREVNQLALSRQEARTDALTGLDNRRAFLESLDAVVGSTTPVAVMIVDLDGFKKINDDFGHEIGDETLQFVATRLRTAAPMAAIARLGGDEFGLIVPITGDTPADVVVDTIARVVSGPIVAAGMAVAVGASVGAAMYPLPSGGPRDLLRAADLAMYRAKRSGRHVEIHDPHVEVIDMRGLLENNRIELRYQPVVDFLTNRVESVEATPFLRLDNGDLRPVGGFVGELERLGLGRAVTRCIIHQALEVLPRLRVLNPSLGIRVDIQTYDLNDQGLASAIATFLTANGLPPSTLTVEVTEPSLTVDPAAAARTVHALRELGVRVAVDHFGAGHSSLAQLMSFDIDELKLDALFAGTVADDERTRTIVRAAVLLAHTLSMRTVCLGINDTQAAASAAALGCDAGQGNHLAHPSTADEVLALLTQQPQLTANPAFAR